MITKTLTTITQSEVELMVELMKIEYSDFENQEITVMANQISKEFDVDCKPSHLELFYSDIVEDWGLESQRVESNYYNEVKAYEDRSEFN